MLNFFKVTYTIGIFLLFISCASTNSPRLCNKDKTIAGDYSKLQKGYTLEIPDDWVGYYDTHCQFAYKPKKSKRNNLYTSVRLIDENLLKVNDSIKNLEDFTNEFVQIILAKNTNPKLTVNYQEHSLYKKYSIVSYKTTFLGNNYTSLNINFYYNSKPYRLSYFAQQNQFPDYLEDFTSMLETFRIVEK